MFFFFSDILQKLRFFFFVKQAQKAKSVLLTPKREDITDLKDLEGEDPVTTHPEDDPTNDMKEEIGMSRVRP